MLLMTQRMPPTAIPHRKTNNPTFLLRSFMSRLILRYKPPQDNPTSAFTACFLLSRPITVLLSDETTLPAPEISFQSKNPESKIRNQFPLAPIGKVARFTPRLDRKS